MKKLMLLIFLVTMSLKSFSQTVTDSTSIKLIKPIARLVIKDLIKGDAALQELVITKQKYQLLEEKIALKDTIIFTQSTKIFNLDQIISNKTNQFKIQEELSSRLQSDLKRQKFKTKLFSIIPLAGLVAVIFILK